MVTTKERRAVYGALRALMSEPGSHIDMWNDLAIDFPEGSAGLVARALIGPNYSDRDAALVYGSMVEQALETAISTHFVTSTEEQAKFFSYADEDSAFPTFAAKTSLGFALGIYDDRMRDDLTCIRNVRNVFAHARVAVDFGHPAIIQACAMIKARNIATIAAEKLARRQYVSATALAAAYLTRSTSGPLRFTDPDHSYDVMYARRDA